MSCGKKCGGFKLLNTGGSLNVPTVVKSVKVVGQNLVVGHTDGTTEKLRLPNGTAADFNEVNITNASGTEVLLTVLTP